MNTFYFKLSKEHFAYASGPPVLVGCDGASGPFDRNARLVPGSNSTAFDVILRLLAQESRFDDPCVVAEPPERLSEYGFEYLGISEEEITRAALIAKLKNVKPATQKSARSRAFQV
jgi:hypothetical protein